MVSLQVQTILLTSSRICGIIARGNDLADIIPNMWNHCTCKLSCWHPPEYVASLHVQTILLTSTTICGIMALANDLADILQNMLHHCMCKRSCWHPPEYVASLHVQTILLTFSRISCNDIIHNITFKILLNVLTINFYLILIKWKSYSINRLSFSTHIYIFSIL